MKVSVKIIMIYEVYKGIEVWKVQKVTVPKGLKIFMN